MLFDASKDMTEIAALRDAITGCRDDVRDVGTRLGRYHGEVQRLTGSLAECRRKVDEHELTLDGPPGNGDKPGLKGRVGALEGSDARLNRAGVAVLVVVVSLVSTVVGGVVTTWIKSM